MRLTSKDVSVTVDAETIECATMVNGNRLRERYSGYTKAEAVRTFLLYANVVQKVYGDKVGAARP